MVSATHVIMTVHPVLVLLPILGLLLLPCAPLYVVSGLRVVANVTVNNTGDCDLIYSARIIPRTFLVKISQILTTC